MGGDEKNWLVIKKHDTAEQASPGGAGRLRADAGDGRRPAAGARALAVRGEVDGYRVMARLEGGVASLTSRRGVDMGGRFAAVARALPHALRTSDCVVDGELCMLDEQRPAQLLA